jgi:hypothetical protein
VAGILEVDSAADPETRRYSLPAEHAEVLLDPDSLDWFAPVVQLVVGLTRPLPALLDAFRSGEGISWSAFGADPREGQAGQNRPAFLKLLGTEWLPAIVDIHAPMIRRPGSPTWPRRRLGALPWRAYPRCASTAST